MLSATNRSSACICMCVHVRACEFGCVCVCVRACRCIGCRYPSPRYCMYRQIHKYTRIHRHNETESLTQACAWSRKRSTSCHGSLTIRSAISSYCSACPSAYFLRATATSFSATCAWVSPHGQERVRACVRACVHAYADPDLGSCCSRHENLILFCGCATGPREACTEETASGNPNRDESSAESDSRYPSESSREGNEPRIRRA